MYKIINSPSVRIKLSGICNRTCNFCNEEGDMRNIESVEPQEDFFNCVHEIKKRLNIENIMLTGGEPMIYPNLYEIINGIDLSKISITTNGIRLYSTKEWIKLREAGLKKVIISIHDATPQNLIQSETYQRSFSWAVRVLESQKSNLITASEAGLEVRVNTVAYHSCGQVYQVLSMLEDLQLKYKFGIRILNNLADIEKSQQIINNVCESLNAEVVRKERRAGSSNATVSYKTESGLFYSTKMSFPYFFNPICNECSIKDKCHEGFYGIRIERRMSDYWVRLCIYKSSSEVLMLWRDFLESPLAEEFKSLCKEEQLDKNTM